MVLNVIKIRILCMFWDKSGKCLMIGQTVTGVKVACVYATQNPLLFAAV